MRSERAIPADRSPAVRVDKFQTGKILALSVAHFVHDVYSSFLAPLLPLLIEKLSMSLTQAGFLTTVMQIPALLNPYIGVLADRISVRYFVILAPAMTAVIVAAPAAAPRNPMFTPTSQIRWITRPSGTTAGSTAGS